MISVVNATGSIVDHTVKKPARRISHLVHQMSKRGSNLMKESSIRSLSSHQSSRSLNNNNKRRVSFSKSNNETYSYPAAQSFEDIPDSDLWYSKEECRDALMQDVMLLSVAPNTVETTRGLELYVNPEVAVFRSRAAQRYVRTIVQKSYESTQYSAKKVLQTSGKKTHIFVWDDALVRYSVQVTGNAKTVAYRMASEDELQAREIYVEDGIVESAEAFAAKTNDSILAKAERAVDGTDFQRRSLLAKSA